VKSAKTDRTGYPVRSILRAGNRVGVRDDFGVNAPTMGIGGLPALRLADSLSLAVGPINRRSDTPVGCRQTSAASSIFLAHRRAGGPLAPDASPGREALRAKRL